MQEQRHYRAGSLLAEEWGPLKGMEQNDGEEINLVMSGHLTFHPTAISIY
jgi:hypothetical protein